MAVWKPMSAVDFDVNKVRIKEGVQLRMIYMAQLHEAIYVLHAFCKKARRV